MKIENVILGLYLACASVLILLLSEFLFGVAKWQH